MIYHLGLFCLNHSKDSFKVNLELFSKLHLVESSFLISNRNGKSLSVKDFIYHINFEIIISWIICALAN